MPAHAALTSDCNCLAVRSAARHVSRFYDQVLAPTGLRTTQVSILAKLARLGPLSIKRLALEMVMDRTTLGRNVLPLQRDGLVRIAPDPDDRRAKQLELTKRGENRLAAAQTAWAAAQDGFEIAFGPTRSAELRAMLRAVVATELPAS
jgi:DNA-binding MarR family transcriptional regulator